VTTGRTGEQGSGRAWPGTALATVRGCSGDLRLRAERGTGGPSARPDPKSGSGTRVTESRYQRGPGPPPGSGLAGMHSYRPGALVAARLLAHSAAPRPSIVPLPDQASAGGTAGGRTILNARSRPGCGVCACLLSQGCRTGANDLAVTPLFRHLPDPCPHCALPLVCICPPC
jgi:hypothetical protein